MYYNYINNIIYLHYFIQLVFIKCKHYLLHYCMYTCQRIAVLNLINHNTMKCIHNKIDRAIKLNDNYDKYT